MNMTEEKEAWFYWRKGISKCHTLRLAPMQVSRAHPSIPEIPIEVRFTNKMKMKVPPVSQTPVCN